MPEFKGVNQCIKQFIKSRDAKIRGIHLGFTTWLDERKMIADRISESTLIISDISKIIADCIGSMHGRAIDLIHNSHKHLFTSPCVTFGTRIEPIQPAELMSNLEQILSILGYPRTVRLYQKSMVLYFFRANKQLRKETLALLSKIVVKHNNCASEQDITNMFYQIVLLTWPDQISIVD